MSRRLGIELSPTQMRAVDVDATSTRGGGARVVVRSASAFGPATPECRETLAGWAGTRAIVTAWGLRAREFWAWVQDGSPEAMRAEGLASLAGAMTDAGFDPRGVWAATIAAPEAERGRRLLCVSVAASDDVRLALAPLKDAGVLVETLQTPGAALLSLALARQALTPRGATEAYVSLVEEAGCLALVRDGFLMGSAYLDWGYLDPATPGLARSPELVARRLTDALGRFLAKYADGAPVRQISVCGGMPDLRSATMPIIQELDIEVETLDYLHSADADAEDGDQQVFGHRVAEMRVVWGMAAVGRSALNLLRQRRATVLDRIPRAAIVAGVLVGFGAGWAIVKSPWWERAVPVAQSTAAAPKPAPRAASATPAASTSPARPQAPPPPLPAPAAPAPPSVPSTVKAEVPAPPVQPVSPAPAAPPPSASAVARATLPSVQTPAAPATRSAPVQPTVARVVPPETAVPQQPPPPPAALVTRSTAPPPALARVAPPAAAVPVQPPAPTVARAGRPVAAPTDRSPGPPPPSRQAPADVLPPAVPPAAAEAVAARPPTPEPAGPGQPPRAAAPDPVRSRVPAVPEAAVRVSRPRESASPFDAVLGTILYSADRKLAIVDGRIVQAGDDVKGARVVEINAGEVLLRDAQGRLRRLTLASSPAR